MSSKAQSLFSSLREKWVWSSLAVRLTAWYTTASFLLVATATLLLYLDLADNLRRISEQALTDEMNVCRLLVLERGNDVHGLHVEVEIDSVVRRYQRFFIRVIDNTGRVVVETPGMSSDLGTPYLTEAATGKSGVFWLNSPRGTAFRALVSTIARDTDGKEIWSIQTAVDLTQELVVLGRQRVRIWMVLGAALLICPGVGFLIARRGTRTLREVAETAHRIGSTTLDARIKTDGYPDEVSSLAAAFNDMLERLEGSFTRLSRFSADIAHELRTPVNNIRGEAEVALARARTPEEYVEVVTSCLEEAVRLSELIESLLFLARSESPGDHLKRTTTDIGALLESLQEYYEAAATEAGVQLAVEAGPTLSVEADEALLQRALGNLVSNALAHCSPGDRILLCAVRQEEKLRIEVRDTGSGIPAADMPHIFDRFYRADAARSRNSGGAGLGLAIVQQIVALHGGTIEIASEPDQGTTVAVLL